MKHSGEIWIERIIKNDGICFLIIRFVSLNKTFLLFGKDLIDFIDNNDRKSIPLEFFEEYCFKLSIKYAPRLDYIKVLDALIEENENTNN